MTAAAPLILIYSPFPDAATAAAAAKRLLEARLIACANILAPGTSLYWWEGAITESTETILILKTAIALAPKAVARLSEIHPYDAPAILQLPAHTTDAFAAWVGAATT